MDVQDNCDRTPLFYAVESGQIEMIQLLTKYKADVDHVVSAG